MSDIISVRTFNEEGITEFEKIIGEIRIGMLKNIPEELIFDTKFSVPFEPINIIEQNDYKNKNQLVPYITDKLGLSTNPDLYFDKGLWSWLSAFYFDNICPTDGNGKRKVNENAFYVLKDPKDYTKYYRHILAYPCRLFSQLNDSAKIFLTGNFSKRGEITEQFGAYQEIALNKGIIDAANILFWDKDNSGIKRGVGGKGSGSARRLIRIIRQYQLTYDLNSMQGSEIVKLLPAEFSKWSVS